MKGNKVREAVHDSGSELLLGDSPLTADADHSLELGQSVVICDGILKGATGTLVNMQSPGHYRVALREQRGQIWASLPAHLLRAD